MKRIITFIVLLAAVLAQQSVWAQTLYVGGVEVDLNATATQTITGSNIDGKVTYSPSSKTLYLDGATIKGSIYGTNLGSSASDRYYIYLKGTNVLTTSNRGMRFDDSYVVMYGANNGFLYVNSSESNSNYSSISTEGGHFEIWSVRLSLIGASKGFYGTPSSASLTFSNAIVQIDCDAGAVYGYKNVSFDDCLVTTDGVSFQSGRGYVNGSGELASSLMVWPLLCVGDEPVRTAASSQTGSRYPWKWTKSTKTLELTGSFSSKAFTGISNYGIEGLTIKSDGDYTVASSNIGVGFSKKTNIAGSGRLNITSTVGNAIVARADVDVMIRELVAQGKLHGFTDLHEGHKLTLKKLNDDSDYRFAGTNRACLYVSSLEMEDMDIYTGDTWWNPSDGYAYYMDNICKSSSTTSGNDCVCFKSTSKISYYDLYVGDKRVRQNCSRIANPNLTSGSIVYDASSKTLTLSDATLTAKRGIYNNSINGLDIKLVGDNTISSYSDEGYVIGSSSSFTITGDGTLTGISRGEADGLLLTGDITCTIDGPQVEFRTGEGCCLLDWQSMATLNVKGSTTQVTFSPAEDMAIWRLGNLVMARNIGILEPAGGRFDASRKSIVTSDGADYMGKVVIGQVVDYGLIIGETRVTSANADDILGDGHFRYDASTKTLTVTNATLTNTSGTLGSIINNYNVYGLNINFVGDNTFTSRMSTIDSQKTFVISGNGTLSCTSTNEAGLYLSGDDVVCYIDGPKAVFAGNFGLIDWSRAAKLYVTGSTTRVTFKPDYNYQAILNLGNLLLDYGFSILEPAEGWFDKSLHSVTTDGSYPYTGTVIIGRAMEGDLNGDSKVDIADAVTVLNIMASGVYDSAADLNNDTKVDIADFVTVLNIMAAQ